jgi:purine-binding chemotaxis protein CheW
MRVYATTRIRSMSLASTGSQPDAISLQALLLVVGDFLYALDGAAVREITQPRPVTRLPGALPHVRGLMNLRGEIITVIDLAQRLTGIPVRNPDYSVILVTANERTLGLLVDDVRDVETLTVIDPVDMPEQPELGDLRRAMGRFGDRIVFVIDVDHLVRETLL